MILFHWPGPLAECDYLYIQNMCSPILKTMDGVLLFEVCALLHAGNFRSLAPLRSPDRLTILKIRPIGVGVQVDCVLDLRPLER